jgi:nicotinamidase-related amidase
MPRPLVADPSQCALIIMDYQPIVLDAMSDADELLGHANEAIDIVRRHGGHVVFVRIAFEDTDYAVIPASNRAFSAVAARRQLRDSEAATGIHPDLALRHVDTVVRKTRVGAFATTKLDERLTNLGVTTLLLAGVHTSGAVLSTVRDAADKDYRLILLSDCVSDPDEKVHDLLMEQVFRRQADIITAAGLDLLFSGPRRIGHRGQMNNWT